VSRYQKGKTNLDFTGSGIRQITTPAPHHSVFTGQMPFLLPNQHRQSTEGFEMIMLVMGNSPKKKERRFGFIQLNAGNDLIHYSQL